MSFAASFAIPIPGWAVLPLLAVGVVVPVAQGIGGIVNFFGNMAAAAPIRTPILLLVLLRTALKRTGFR